MTERASALTVILEQDVRTDDLEPLMTAIQQLRGVIAVEPYVAGNLDLEIARHRERERWTDKLRDLLREEWAR